MACSDHDVLPHGVTFAQIVNGRPNWLMLLLRIRLDSVFYLIGLVYADIAEAFSV